MRKIKAKKAPLSALDKFIYFLCMLFGLGAFPFILWFFMTLPINIAFSNVKTVAAELEAMSLLFMPLLMFPFAFAVPVGMMIDAKQPIFGNKKFKPKWSDNIAKTYPLFSDDFKKLVWPQKRKKAVRYVIIVSILLVISIFLSLLAVYPRSELDSDYNLYTYNSFNEVTDTKNVKDAEEITFGIGSGRKSSYKIFVSFVFEDKTYTFWAKSFDEMSTVETLEYLIHLKTIFEDKCKIEGTDKMEYLLRDRGYTGKEKELVYELFDYP